MATCSCEENVCPDEAQDLGGLQCNRNRYRFITRREGSTTGTTGQMLPGAMV
jgi:hypothetical protein